MSRSKETNLFAESIDVIAAAGKVLGQDWMRRFKYGGELPQEPSSNNKTTSDITEDTPMHLPKPGSQENLRAKTIHTGPDHATKMKIQRIQELTRKGKIGNRKIEV